MQPWNSILNDLKKACLDGSQTEYSTREPNPLLHSPGLILACYRAAAVHSATGPSHSQSF